MKEWLFLRYFGVKCDS